MTTQKTKGLLNANTLRMLAMSIMLVDHLGAFVFGSLWMRCVGRLAFPVFAFQISEGLVHTSNQKRYAARLLLFALISEIPFDLMVSQQFFQPAYQNVMFTLFLGFWAISALDKAKQEPSALHVLWAGFQVLASCLLAEALHTDYGMMGVAMVIAFSLCRGFPAARLCQLGSMLLLCVVLSGGGLFLIGLPGGGQILFPIQALAVLALGLIWLYNGEKGKSSRAFQYAAYAFYPAHMLVIALLEMLA